MNNLPNSAWSEQPLPPDHKTLPLLPRAQVRFEDRYDASDDLPRRLECPTALAGDPASPVAAGETARLAWMGTIEKKRRIDPPEPAEQREMGQEHPVRAEITINQPCTLECRPAYHAEHRKRRVISK